MDTLIVVIIKPNDTSIGKQYYKCMSNKNGPRSHNSKIQLVILYLLICYFFLHLQ
jgi:hypothetical protein